MELQVGYRFRRFIHIYDLTFLICTPLLQAHLIAHRTRNFWIGFCIWITLDGGGIEHLLFLYYPTKQTWCLKCFYFARSEMLTMCRGVQTFPKSHVARE